MATNPASVRDTDVKLTMAPDGVRSGAGGAGAGARDGEAKVDGKAKPEAKAEDVPFKTLLRYAETTDYVLYFVGTIAGIANGLTMPLFSLVFGELLNSFNPADDGADIMEGVSKWAMWISLAGVGAWLMSYLEVACFSVAAERQARTIRDKYFAALLNQDIGWFDSQTTEALVTKVADETRTIKDGIGDKVGLGIRFVATFFGGFIMAFIEGWQLTLLLMLMAPLMAIAGAFMMKLMADLETMSAKLYADAGAIAQERLAGVRTVQAFGGQRQALSKYGSVLDGSLKAGIKKGFLQGGSMAFTMLTMFCTYGLAFWFGSKLIADDREDALAVLAANGCAAEPDFSVTCSPAWELTEGPTCASLCNSIIVPCIVGDTCHTGGNVVLVFFAVIIGAMAIGQATPSFTAAAQAKVAGFQVFSVIDRPVRISAASTEGTRVVKEEVQGGIVLRDVHFSYPSRPDRRVLDGLSLTIEPGSTVALVGRSGCGKSTVVSLIQRFYDPDSGTVELDDLGAITNLNVRSLRDCMGLVGQEPVLFQTTVRENIKLGSKNKITDQDVEAAARMANAHDFIMEFKDNYETDVGERGSALSGGQKQRVAIARALVRQPKILLLDEATSALDSQSEQVVQAALNTIMASRNHTTVVIAHRLSTIKNADKIVVLDQGKAVEEGTHDTLMQIEGGIYRDLVEAQMSGRDGNLTELAEPAESKLDGDDAKQEEADDAEIDRARSRSRSRSRSRTASVFTIAPDAEEGVDTSMTRIFKLNLPHWPWLISAFLSAMINGSIFPLFSIAFSEMITLFFEPNIQAMRDDGVFWGVAFVILGVLAGVAALGMFGSFAVVGQHLARRLRVMAFDAMLHKDMAFHDKEDNSTGVLATQLATDATLVNAMASERSAIAAQNLVTAVVGLSIAFSADWRLSLVVLACAPVIAIAGSLQMKMFTGQTVSAQKSLERAGHVVEESVHGIRTIAAFNLGDEMCSRYRERLAKPQAEGIKSGHTSGFGFGFSQFVMFATYGLSFYVGGLWVEDGSLTFGNMMRVLMTIMMTAMALGQSNSLAPDAAKAKQAVKNIFTTIDKAPEVNCHADDADGVVPPSVQGHIEFHDLVFSYPTRKGRVLDHVSLDVPAGTSLALVGSSGSGKSTLVQLLQRFYDTNEGAVLLDGRNIKTLKCHEPTLFNGTVLDNIKYGLVAESDDPDLGPDEDTPLIDGDKAGDDQGEDSATWRGTHKVPAAIVRAAKDANAHNFIIRMKDGYHTVIKPDSLSGGQKQRVAIARAILRDPPILLLDEATSALDNRSEHIVQAALDALMADKARQRTTVVIAHRLSTIYRSDNIVVMHKGQIVEQGTHEFLISDQAPYGKYRTMWEQQSLLAKGAGNGGGKGAAK